MPTCQQLRHRPVRYGHERVDGIDLYRLPCTLCGALPGARHSKRCPIGMGSAHIRPTTCTACGTGLGHLHAPGCAIEVCRGCGYQLLTCDCED